MRDHRKLRAFERADEVDLLIHRESQAEHIRFLETAFGSLRELHDQLGLSKRLGYSYEREISTCETKFVEAEEVSGALLRSMRE